MYKKVLNQIRNKTLFLIKKHRVGKILPVIFIISGLLVLATPVLADGIITWKGQGSENLPCENGGHWVLSPAFGIDSATVIVDNIEFTMHQSGNGSWSADSTGYIDSTVTARVAYTGNGDSRDHLQLSHCVGSNVTNTPSPTETPKPSSTPKPTKTIEPTETIAPTETVEPTATQPVDPTHTATPVATKILPAPTLTPISTSTPSITNTPVPPCEENCSTETPVPTETPNPTGTLSPTKTKTPPPGKTVTPSATSTLTSTRTLPLLPATGASLPRTVDSLVLTKESIAAVLEGIGILLIGLRKRLEYLDDIQK